MFNNQNVTRVLNLHSLSFQVAIKSIRKEKIKDEQDMVHIRREIEIMSTLRHPHIISIYEGEGREHARTHIHAREAKPCMPISFAGTLNANVQNSPHPERSAPVARLQNCHVMTCGCHNRRWTTALGCYSSPFLCLAA